MKKLTLIAAARPNFMKVDPLLRALLARGVDAKLVHTGQHYDKNMSQDFFRDLDIRTPDVNLEVGSGSHAEQTARVMLAYEQFFLSEKPDWTVVVGDVNSTLACALVASKLGGQVCHVEAGLRSGDWSMPEELNRVLTDRVSSLLFTPSPDADENLISEGINTDRIYCVGNVMIDTLLRLLPKARNGQMLSALNLEKGGYAVLTLHRPSNVDEEASLRNVVSILQDLSEKLKIVFPAHPRTRKMLGEYGLLDHISRNTNIILTEPLGYLAFLSLVVHSRLVITDSGGLQEETTVLRIPCLTMRENTERPITVEKGTNEIVGSCKEKILDATTRILEGKWKKGSIPELWDGHAAERCADILIKYLEG